MDSVEQGAGLGRIWRGKQFLRFMLFVVVNGRIQNLAFNWEVVAYTESKNNINTRMIRRTIHILHVIYHIAYYVEILYVQRSNTAPKYANFNLFSACLLLIWSQPLASLTDIQFSTMRSGQNDPFPPTVDTRIANFSDYVWCF